MDSQPYDRRAFLKMVGAGAATGSLLSYGGTQHSALEADVAAPAIASDLCFMSARDLAALIRTRKVSAREVMAAHLACIGRLNPRVNAIVAKLDDDKCLALADAADRVTAKGDALPPLHGLPTAF